MIFVILFANKVDFDMIYFGDEMIKVLGVMNQNLFVNVFSHSRHIFLIT